MTFFCPEKRVVSKYKREEKRINHESHIDEVLRWATDRDIKILRLLLDHPFLNTHQIAMMIFSDLKPSSWQNRASERLRRLYRSYLIDRWYPPVGSGEGSSKSHYVLEPLGAKVIAKYMGYDHKKVKYRKRKYIVQTYQHSLKIFDFKAMLYVLNRQLGVIRYDDGTEGTVGEIINWKTEHETKIRYRYEGERNGELIPDALCIYKYKANGAFKMFFLEVDNATMDLDEQLKPKIRRYIDCYRSGDWREKEWAHATNLFPSVLILMHDDKSVNELRKYIKSLRSNIKFYLSTYDKLISTEEKEYINRLGKSRKVLQDIKIHLLDEIWKSNHDDKYVSII